MESGNDTFALKEPSPTSPVNANVLHHPNTFLAASISEKNERGSGTTIAFDQRQQNTPSRLTLGSKTKRKSGSKRNQNKTNRKVFDPVPTLGDGKLEKMTIKELNKYIQGIPKQQAQKIKNRRRILKNRKYALKCRLKTVQKRTKMAEENKSLEKRISAAKEELKTVTKQRDYRATNQNIYSFMRLLNQNSLK